MTKLSAFPIFTEKKKKKKENSIFPVKFLMSFMYFGASNTYTRLTSYLVYQYMSVVSQCSRIPA